MNRTTVKIVSILVDPPSSSKQTRGQFLRSSLIKPQGVLDFTSPPAKKILLQPVPETKRYLSSRKDDAIFSRQLNVINHTRDKTLVHGGIVPLFCSQQTPGIKWQADPLYTYVYGHDYYYEWPAEDDDPEYFEWLAKNPSTGLMMLLSFPTGTYFLDSATAQKIADISWAGAHKYIDDNLTDLEKYTEALLKAGAPKSTDVNYLVFGGTDFVKFSGYTTDYDATAKTTTISVKAETVPGMHSLKGSVDWKYVYDHVTKKGKCTFRGTGQAFWGRDHVNYPVARMAFSNVSTQVLVNGRRWWRDHQDMSFREYLTQFPIAEDNYLNQTAIWLVVRGSQWVSKKVIPPPTLAFIMVMEPTSGQPVATPVWLDEDPEDSKSLPIELLLQDDLFLTALGDPKQITDYLTTTDLLALSKTVDPTKNGLYIGDIHIQMNASEALFTSPRYCWSMKKDTTAVAKIVGTIVTSVLTNSLLEAMQISIFDRATDLANRIGSMKRLCTPIQPPDFDDEILPPDLYDLEVLKKGMYENGVLDDVSDTLDDHAAKIIDAIKNTSTWKSTVATNKWSSEDAEYSLNTLVAGMIVGYILNHPDSIIMSALHYTAVRFMNTLLLNDSLQLGLQKGFVQLALKKYEREISDLQYQRGPNWQSEVDDKGFFRDFYQARLESISNAEPLKTSSAKRQAAEKTAKTQQDTALSGFSMNIANLILYACEDGARDDGTGITPLTAGGSQPGTGAGAGGAVTGGGTQPPPTGFGAGAGAGHTAGGGAGLGILANTGPGGGGGRGGSPPPTPPPGSPRRPRTPPSPQPMPPGSPPPGGSHAASFTARTLNAPPGSATVPAVPSAPAYVNPIALQPAAPEPVIVTAPIPPHPASSSTSNPGPPTSTSTNPAPTPITTTTTTTTVTGPTQPTSTSSLPAEPLPTIANPISGQPPTPVAASSPAIRSPVRATSPVKDETGRAESRSRPTWRP